MEQAAGAPGGVIAESEARAAGALGLAPETAPVEVALRISRGYRLGQDVFPRSFYPAV